MAINQPAAPWVPPPPPTQNNTTLPPPGTSLNANGSLHHLAPLSAPGPGWVDPRITAMQKQQATNAAYMANVAKQNPGMSATTATPTGTNTVDNTTVALNPFSVQQFQQMYAQNPTIALKMYNMDQQAGGKNAINTAMGWGNQAIGDTPGASNFIKTYSAGGSGYNPNAGFTPGGQMYSFSPGQNSNVNEGSLQKFLATGSSKLYGSNPANIPGLTMYGNMDANPQSYAGQFQAGQQSPGMSNLNSQVGTNGPYGAGYTGYGNSSIAGPSPTGPTNLPTGPGVGTSSGSSNGIASGGPQYNSGPDSGNIPQPAAPWTPPPATPAGTPMGGPGTAGIGAPSIGPTPTPTPSPTSGNTGGGYAGTNISNSNYNNRFGTSARPV